MIALVDIARRRPRCLIRVRATPLPLALRTTAMSANLTDVKTINPQAEVLESRAMRMLFTTIRNKRTNQRDYVQASDRLMSILAEEGLARLATVVETVVETPCGPYTGLLPPVTGSICAVDIVRSGGCGRWWWWWWWWWWCCCCG